MPALDNQVMSMPSEVGLGKPKKKKKKAKAKGRKKGKKFHQERGHHHKDGPVLIAGWKKKCLKDKAWCDKFLWKFIEAEESGKLFGGKKRPHLTEKFVIKICDKCEKMAGIDIDKTWSFGTKKQQLKSVKCIDINFTYVELFGKENWLKKERIGRRSARLAKENATEWSAGSLTFWLALGVMLLLVFASIGAYFALFRGKKGKDSLGKGSTKLGKLKSRRSGKSSKSARMSSRKSAKQSAKRSASGKSRASPGRGAKKSANKK